MTDTPKITPVVHIGNGHFISEDEARFLGVRPRPVPKPAQQPAPVQATRSDRLFEALLLVVIIGLGSAFASWLNVAMWGR